MAFSFTEPTTTHPTSDAAPEETQEATTDVTTDPDTVDTNADVQSDTGDTDAGDAGGEDPKGETQEGEGKEEDKPAGSSQEEVSYFFGGEEVTIEVPQDVEEELKAKGLDAYAIAAELYAKDGDFSLSEETKQKLYDAFGKFAVDAYLSGLKAQNEASCSAPRTKPKNGRPQTCSASPISPRSVEVKKVGTVWKSGRLRFLVTTSLPPSMP